MLLGAWADSTFDSYNRALSKMYTYCVSMGIPFPPSSSAHMASYVAFLAGGSQRPQSAINTASSAVKCYQKALGDPTVVDDDVHLLMRGCVKVGSSAPMRRSRVMPIQAYRDLFMSWPNNAWLSIANLRLKCITLLSLTAMLRPSDAASQNKVFDQESMNMTAWVFSTDQLKFNDDGDSGIINYMVTRGLSIMYHSYKGFLLAIVWLYLL